MGSWRQCERRTPDSGDQPEERVVESVPVESEILAAEPTAPAVELEKTLGSLGLGRAAVDVDRRLDPWLGSLDDRFDVGGIEDLGRYSLGLGSYGRLNPCLETLGDPVLVDPLGDHLDLDHVAVDDTVDPDLELGNHDRCCSLVVDRGSVVVTCDAGHLDPLGLESRCLDRSVGDGLGGWKCKYVGEHPRASSHQKYTCTRKS